MAKVTKKPLPTMADVSKQDYPKYFKQGTSSFTKVTSEKECIQVKLLQTQTSITKSGNKHLIADVLEYGERIDADKFQYHFNEALNRIKL